MFLKKRFNIICISFLALTACGPRERITTLHPHDIQEYPERSREELKLSIDNFIDQYSVTLSDYISQASAVITEINNTGSSGRTTASSDMDFYNSFSLCNPSYNELNEIISFDCVEGGEKFVYINENHKDITLTFYKYEKSNESSINTSQRVTIESDELLDFSENISYLILEDTDRLDVVYIERSNPVICSIKLNPIEINQEEIGKCVSLLDDATIAFESLQIPISE